MICTENVTIRGKTFVRTYSDENKFIIQSETWKKYMQAIDVLESAYTYTESDEVFKIKEELSDVSEYVYIPSQLESATEFALKYFDIDQIQDVDEKLKCSGLVENWEPGNYSVGDFLNANEQTWECWTAHDNAIYPDITPDSPQAWANFWRPLHGTSKETARPWVKPQYGTTDMYHAGEYMVWTDGTIKKCLRDTVYSPEEYAADWEDAE